MSKEIIVSSLTGQTIYAVGRVANGDNIGRWGNVADESLDVFDEADWVKYAITLTELGSTGLYEADFPTVFAPERAIDLVFYIQAGAVLPAQSDAKLLGALFELMDDWVPTVPLSV